MFRSYNSTLDVEVMNLVINFYRLLGLNEFILKLIPMVKKTF